MDSRQTSLQRFFLGRLQRLARLSALDPSVLDRVGGEEVLDTAARMRLLHRAIFSTYLDCVEENVEAEAKSIIEQIRVASA